MPAADCFQPIKIFEATTGRPVLALLRPGKRPSGEEVEQILRHVIGRIRHNWPAVEIMVRGDSHFATPEVMDLLEEKRCSYIFGLSTNTRLIEIGRPWSEDVATRRALSKTQKMRRFFQTSYAAASWSKPRKVVARVEAKQPARQRHTLHRHQSARPGKSPLRKGLLRARTHGESHQGHEALHALRPHLLPSLGGQSV